MNTRRSFCLSGILSMSLLSSFALAGSGMTARDIDGGNCVHIIDNGSPQGYIWYWDNYAWQRYPRGAAMKVSVGFDGIPWVITSSNSIHRWDRTTSSWIQVPGTARDLDIGANGDIYKIGMEGTPQGRISKWNGSSWDMLPSGAAVSIAVTSDGIPVVITQWNSIHYWNGSSWIQLPGTARAVDVGGYSGTVFIIGTDGPTWGYAYYWNGSGWSRWYDSPNDIPAIGIGVNNTQQDYPSLIGTDNKIYHWDQVANHWVEY